MSFQNAPFTPESEGAYCANHPESRAIGTCTRCGTFICSQCYTVGADGNYYCFPCDAKNPDAPVAERWDRFVANLADYFVVLLPWIMGGALAGILEGAFGEKTGDRSSGLVAGLTMSVGGLLSLSI